MKLITCPVCHGDGGYKEVICDDGIGPWEDCGICEGTGFVTQLMWGWAMQWFVFKNTKWYPLDERIAQESHQRNILNKYLDERKGID